MMRFSCFARYAACALCCTVLALPVVIAQTDAGGKAYARIYVENRCYHTVDIAIEREKGEVSLPSVPPRDTGIVLFAWMKNMAPEEMIRLSRRDAGDKRLMMQEFLDGARREQWVMGKDAVDSWFVTICAKELPLGDPDGVTIRPAVEGERVAEYEVLFSRVPGSVDPMHIYAGYPVRLSLNGMPLRILTTGNDGMLRFFLPDGTTGTVTLEAVPDITRTLMLGSSLAPVWIRAAKAGEKVLVAPKPAGSPADW